MTNGVFFLKAAPPQGVTWPAGTKLVVLDPTQYGLGCDGADALCSTAYSNLYAHLKGSDGRVLPGLRKKYGIDGKVAFVSFSAGHGFMNPFLANASDRADTSAVLLADSTFGGGKSGYVEAAGDAAAGRMLLVSPTSDKKTSDALNNGDYAFREFVLKPAGLIGISSASAKPPMPVPSEGVFNEGDLWYYRYADAELHHWDMGKILKPLVQAHLLPYWAGERSGTTSGGSWLKVAVVGAAAVIGFFWVRGRVGR